MWAIAMFDVLTETRTHKKNWALLQNGLEKDEFSKLTDTVYVRHCASEASATARWDHIKASMPYNVKAWIVTVTDEQFHRKQAWGWKSEASGNGLTGGITY